MDMIVGQRNFGYFRNLQYNKKCTVDSVLKDNPPGQGLVVVDGGLAIEVPVSAYMSWPDGFAGLAAFIVDSSAKGISSIGFTSSMTLHLRLST